MSLFLTCKAAVQGAAAPKGEMRITKSQILEQSCRITYDFCFGEQMTTMDSPRFVFTMIMDAFQPFLGQYYRVRLLPFYVCAWSQVECPTR